MPSITSFAGRCAATAALAAAVLVPLHAHAEGPAAGGAATVADLADGTEPGAGTGTGTDDFIWNVAPKPAPAPGAAAHA